MAAKGKPKRFALCVRNDDCEDLELRKIYGVLSDERAAEDGYLRIIDESGEDYLYPEAYFVIVELPERARAALAKTG